MPGDFVERGVYLRFLMSVVGEYLDFFRVQKKYLYDAYEGIPDEYN